MSLVYIDGLEDNGAVFSTSGTVTYNVAARTGNGIQATGSSGSFRIRFPQPYVDTVTVGFAWRPTSLSGNLQSPAPVTLMGDGSGTTHVSMNVNGGNIEVCRSTSTIIVSSASPPFPAANRWYYVELQAKLSDTVGFVKVNVDGVSVINSAATLDTKNAGTGTWFDTVQFGMGVSGTSIFDDLYLMAGTGDSFQGDVVVSTLLPTGNGNVNQFVGSDADSTDNYLLVDELPPSGTDYVYSSTIGQQDLYTLGNLPASAGTILAVAPTVYAAKDEVGPRQVKPLLRGSTTTAGTAQALDFAYAQKQSVYTTNPEGGGAWTASQVNALEAGVEVA